MRLYLLSVFLLLGRVVYAQDDADATLQKAQEALKQAQAAVNAAVQAKQASDKSKGINTPADTTAAPSQKLQPIDVGLDIYTDGTVGANYSYDGRPLNSFQDFKDVIHTLNDTKCNNLLDASSTEDTLAWVSMVVGTGLVAYYTIDVINKADAAFSSTTDVGPSITADTPIIIGSTVVYVAGGILFLASQGDFNHAINRYNHQVAKKNQLSFYFDPNPNKPELGLVQRF